MKKEVLENYPGLLFLWMMFQRAKITVIIFLMKYTLINKFKYWLDKQMSKGTVSIIRLLTIAVLAVAIFVSTFEIAFKISDAIISTFWDSLVSIFNSSMPSSEEGTLLYIVLNTISALAGIFFSSLLIGIVSSAFEEKVESLRKGNSVVLEKNHTVVLGYNLGEHGLLKQLILAAKDKRKVIVILTDIEKPEIEQDIQNSIEVPKNIEIICRNGDITKVNSLRCCSLEYAEVVIVNALNDNRRTRAILAVSKLKKEFPEFRARIVSCVSDERHLLPYNSMINNRMSIMMTDDFTARVLAHTSTEPGLSIAFRDMLNFEGAEFYFEEDVKFIGKSILELASFVDKAAIIGVIRNGEFNLNPDEDYVVELGDKLIVYEDSKGSYEIKEIEMKNVTDREFKPLNRWPKGKMAIFGCNKLLETIVGQITTDIDEILLVSQYQEELEAIANKIDTFKFEIISDDNNEELEYIASRVNHIIILTEEEEDKEDADTDAILTLLKLADLRERNNYGYNITCQLNLESSFDVAPKQKNIDYLIGSNVASLLLGQVSQNSELEKIFGELLSREGDDFYSKPIKSFNLGTEHDYSFRALKQIVLSYKYTMIGYIHDDEPVLNPSLDDRISFDDDDRLIVLGEQ